MFWITPVSFDALSSGIPVNICINLIMLELESSPLMLWVYLHSNFYDGFIKCMQFETKCIVVVQGHPMSLIWVPIENQLKARMQLPVSHQ